MAVEGPLWASAIEVAGKDAGTAGGIYLKVGIDIEAELDSRLGCHR